MAQLIVRNIEDNIIYKLRKLAQSRGQSMEVIVREIQQTRESKGDLSRFGTSSDRGYRGFQQRPIGHSKFESFRRRRNSNCQPLGLKRDGCDWSDLPCREELPKFPEFKPIAGQVCGY